MSRTTYVVLLALGCLLAFSTAWLLGYYLLADR